MGREAVCSARWGARSGEVKALLKSTEIVVRGAFRAVAPLAELRDVRADGDTLRFSVRGEEVALMLGAAAPRWAAKIAAGPPSLAAKLGIGSKTRLFVAGRIDDPALSARRGRRPFGRETRGMERHGEIRLLVRGIARGVSSDEIAELFAPFGVDRERIALPRDRRTRRRKGMAYLFVPSARHATDAIAALNGTALQDKTITIEAAAERPPKRPRRFSGPPRRF